MIAIWILVGGLFSGFLLIVFRGAPYVPTRARDIETLFEMQSFGKGDVLVDLGSGDGRIQIAAAKRGVRSVGYELNPFLALLGYLRTRSYRSLTSTRLADFWLTPLPPDAKVVFVFLAGPFMKKLDRRLTDEAKRLGRDIILISYGIQIPSKQPETKKGGYVRYVYKA